MSASGRPGRESVERRREDRPAGGRGIVLLRALLYFGVWVVCDQSAKPADLAVGLLAAAAATWVSMRLLPPAGGSVRLGVLLTLLPRFLWQSLVAGVDVARRAFSPRLPLAPGFVDYPVRLPRGPARNAFELISSLMPGSVASAETEATIEYHCLDAHPAVVGELAADERAYSRALLPGRRDG